MSQALLSCFWEEPLKGVFSKHCWALSQHEVQVQKPLLHLVPFYSQAWVQDGGADKTSGNYSRAGQWPGQWGRPAGPVYSPFPSALLRLLTVLDQPTSSQCAMDLGQESWVGVQPQTLEI